jgi:hypothetical protein
LLQNLAFVAKRSSKTSLIIFGLFNFITLGLRNRQLCNLQQSTAASVYLDVPIVPAHASLGMGREYGTTRCGPLVGFVDSASAAEARESSVLQACYVNCNMAQYFSVVLFVIRDEQWIVPA